MARSVLLLAAAGLLVSFAAGAGACAPSERDGMASGDEALGRCAKQKCTSDGGTTTSDAGVDATPTGDASTTADASSPQSVPPDAVNAKDYGYGSTSVAAQDAINMAIAAAATSTKSVLIPYTNSSGQHLSGSILMKSGVMVYLRDTLSSAAFPIVEMTNVDDAGWDGGTINGSGATGGQTGFMLKNANRNRLTGIALANIGNKAIDLVASTASGTSTTYNYVAGVTVSGSMSPTGVALSMFGDGVRYNTVEGGDYSYNRAGITINSGRYNKVTGAVANYNTDIGMTIDGIVTGSGDGGQYNVFTNVTANGNGTANTSYAGIFVGNGSKYNRFESPVCSYNKGAGIYQTGGVGFEPSSNVYVNPQCEGNGLHGINLSTSPNTQITNPTLLNNGTQGIQIYDSDATTVDQGHIQGNKSNGVVINSPNCKITNVVATNNAGYGVLVSSAGISNISGNEVAYCDLRGNAAGPISFSSGTTSAHDNILQ